MKVLIVEDDAYKLDALSEVVNEIASPCSIDPCRSVQSAVSSLAANEYDIVVLDMSLPSHDLEKGSMLGIPRLSGGMEVLFELDYSSASSKIIIVTQYPEIEMSGELVSLDRVINFISREYLMEVTACIYYDPDTKAWRQEMISAVRGLLNK